MRFGLLVTCILFVSVSGYSNDFWKRDYATIDSLARNVKPTRNLEKLTENLTGFCRTDVEKYRSIFTWISHNIAYDFEGKRNPAMIELDPVKIIKDGKAVCAGYSALFLQLCKLANLECVTITGWSKEKENIGKLLGKTNHAWSAIRIENEWYLCDVTWGAGKSTGSTDTFTFEFDDSYFCTPPNVFALKHFPEDKKWLLGENVSAKEFNNKPLVYSRAVNSNLQDIEPSDGSIKFKKDKVIEFKIKLDAKPNRVSIKPSTAKKSTEIMFSIDENGVVEFEYTMHLFSPYLYVFLDGKALAVYKMTR
jgi:hypothetical protein